MLSEVNFIHFTMREVYGRLYLDHLREESRYDFNPRILWTDEKFQLRRRLDTMLNFKNDKGEIVMTESDQGKLEIHDDVLKESLENKLSLEEAVMKQKEQNNA